MRSAPLAADEQRRLERLRALAVLDTAPEPFFDEIARVASLVTGSPTDLVSLVGPLPGHLTDTQREILGTLAGLVGMALDQRETAGERNAALAREITLERDLRRSAEEWEAHRRRAVASLEASERRFRQLFHYSLGLICTHDLDGILLSVNPAAARSLGYPINSLMGRSLAEFMRPEMVPAFNAYLRRIVDEGSDSGRLELRAANGDLRIWAYHNVLDEDEDERYVLGHAQDITEQHRQERQLREWSLSDPLTHCFNRRYLGQLGELTRDESLGCITVDLDHFKALNDTYGHQRGDDVLVDMAKFLRARVRDEDAVVRLGGDEFLVVLRSADNTQLIEVSTRLRDEAQAAPIAFTLGSAIKAAGTPLDAALCSADQRLYEARATRRAR
jgi:diguanylate cyclase (GGDEF)-like protein/PAS domain S-box-containing protein